MPALLSLKNVNIARSEFVLCHNVSFELARGEICHLLGENGLGKTTLLMQIVGLLPTLSGQIDYLGNQVAKGAVYLPHQTGVQESLTVRQNLAFLLALYGVTPSDEQLEIALQQAGLAGLSHVPARELSAGQTRRISLARLWLLTPDISPLWVLDEPLTALDVAMVATLSARLKAFAGAGGAVLLTSHQPIDIATKTVDLSDFLTFDDTLKTDDDLTLDHHFTTDNGLTLGNLESDNER